MKTAELRMIPVSELKPAEYNPRKKLKPGDKEYEKIKNSIEEFGFADPLVVNADMTIIGGHQRLTVAMALGYTEVPCAVVDIDKVREKALNIALNKITGAWDENLLAELLEDIQSSDFDLGKTGFDPPEIEQLFNQVHDKQVKEDNFDVEEELKKPTFSQPGDIWILGRHRVICGDSTVAETYTKLMEGQKANLVLTDPPYNVDVEETAGKIMNDNMSDSDFYNFLLSAYQCMYDSLADDGSIYVWHADTEGLNFRKAFKDAGFQLSGCCIWKKNSLVLGRSPYQWIHEPCLFGWKQKGKHQWYGDEVHGNSTVTDDFYKYFGGEDMKGIDVSVHNGNIDWGKVKADGIDFAIIRAGYGRLASQKDEKFEQNYAGAKAVGLPIGAYWYSYAMTPEEAELEADVFLSVIKGKQFEMPVYFDLEEKKQFDLGKEQVSAIMRAFLKKVEIAGYFVGLYGSASSLTTHTADDIKSWYTIWLAHWVDQTNYSGAYGIWQHSEKGRVDGINGNVDLDICYKDFPTIIKGKGLNGWGKTPEPAPDVPDADVTVTVQIGKDSYKGTLKKV